MSFFLFHLIDMKFVIGPDQAYFSFNNLFIFEFIKKS
jgi:hypothetical protein